MHAGFEDLPNTKMDIPKPDASNSEAPLEIGLRKRAIAADNKICFGKRCSCWRHSDAVAASQQLP